MPEYFEIFDTGLWVEGWLYQQPKYRIDYMEIVLKTTIQSEEQPWSTSCVVDLPDQHPGWAESEVMISQCFINEAIFAIHSQELLSFKYQSDDFTTTEMATLLGPAVYSKFQMGNQCRANISTTYPAPMVELSVDSYLQVTQEYLRANLLV